METDSWKIVLVIVLSISFLFLSYTAVESLRKPDISPHFGAPRQTKQQSLAALTKEIRFYPPVPATLPDLNAGYLFNQDRNLKPFAPDTSETADHEPDIDMDEIFYDGSLISGSSRKVLIRYPTFNSPAMKRSMRTTSNRIAAQKWSFMIVMEGDMVSGYRVISISAKTLVFGKDGNQVEKSLYASDKEREAFIPPATRSMPPNKPAIRKPAEYYPAPARTGSSNPAKRYSFRNNKTARGRF